MTSNPTLILEAIIQKNEVTMSIYERGSTVHQYEEISISLPEIKNYCEEIIKLLNKANEAGKLASGIALELKKVGQVLYDQLLTESVKRKLKNTEIEDLLIHLDEGLVQIPWELLFDGKQFLCLKFNVGRSVKTRQSLRDSGQRTIEFPIKMLVLADPTGDLKAARQEAGVIEKELDKTRKFINVGKKVTNINTSYVKKNLRDYDIVHYAGHADYDIRNPSNSGWKLEDGRFTARDISSMGATAPLPSLIFSNSCQSAHTKEWIVDNNFEEEIFGLANAFLCSGVRHYIGASWKVPDGISLCFAKEFYSQIAQGGSVGSSIRKARLRIIEDFGEDTIVWASYVLYGDPIDHLLSFESRQQSQNKNNLRTYTLILSAILFLMFAGFSIKAIFNRLKPKSIAVLNFDNLNENRPDWNLTHSIAANLANVPYLNVIDMSVLLDLNEFQKKTIKEICRPYGIDMIIRGRYMNEGGQIKAVISMENPQNGRIYEVKELFIKDEIELVDKVTFDLLEMLRINISESQKQSLKKSSTNNVAAYRIFSKTWELFLGGNNKEAIEFCKKALELDPEYLDVYKRLGNIYDVLGDKASALKSYLEYAHYSEKKGDKVNFANALINIGWIYHDSGDYEKAYDYYNQGTINAIEANSKLIEAKGYRQLATWYYDKEDYDSALSLLMKSSAINKANFYIYDHKYNLACDYNELGYVLTKKEEYPRALDFFKKALNIYKSIGAKKQVDWVTERIVDEISSAYTGMGDLYLEKKDYSKAEEYYLKGLEIDLSLDWKLGLTADYRSIGNVYLERRDFQNALENYNKSIELAIQINDQVSIAATYDKMGELYAIQSNNLLALDYYNKAMAIYERVGLPGEEVRKEIDRILNLLGK